MSDIGPAIQQAQQTGRTRLDLRGSHLTNLPAEIGQLTNLRELYLCDNHLTSLPVEIAQLTNLRVLYIRNNQLTCIPAEIRRLINLKVLYLRDNQLTHLPEGIGQLNLNSLFLRGNQLTSLPPEIGRLTNLRELDLRDNHLTSLPVEIAELTNLKGLYLHDNHLSNLPAEVGQLTNLKWLNVRSNRLTSLAPEIGQLSVLRELDLGDNHLSSLPVDIGQLSNLRKLYLDGNQLVSLPAEMLQLTNLTQLNLVGNRLTGLPLKIGELTLDGDVYSQPRREPERLRERFFLGAATYAPLEVYLGAATPRVVSPDSQFVARFLAYTEQFRDKVETLLNKETPKSEAILGLGVCEWKVGTKVTVRMEARGLYVARKTQEFVWNGEWEMILFEIEVPSDAKGGHVALKFDVGVDGMGIAQISPEIEIKRHREAADHRGEVRIETRAPRTAFASYASNDKKEVLGRVRSVEIQTSMDIFVDCLSIHPGEKWKSLLLREITDRDVFILFWSRSAMDSPWVEWEWRHALERKTIDGIQPHPLEPADLAPPPSELAELQFGGAYECYLASLRS